MKILTKQEARAIRDRDPYALFDCVDCSTYTGSKPGVWNPNYYMVQHNIWIEFGAGHGMLCRSCLEKRMNRLLTLEDYLDCPLNYLNGILKT